MVATLFTKFLVLTVFLAVHVLAHVKGWYYSRPSIDTITHFLGGLALSAFVKDWTVAIALIIGWEVLEMLLVNKRWHAFRETPLNKARDILMGLLGFIIGIDFL